MHNREAQIMSRVIQMMAGSIVEMMHEGKITPEEANQMYQKAYDPEIVAQEVEHYKENDGIMPLGSQASRLNMLRLKLRGEDSE
ncbi:hypothetical protein ACFL0Y_04670 [Patescibacteria group bacterium]